MLVSKAERAEIRGLGAVEMALPGFGCQEESTRPSALQAPSRVGPQALWGFFPHFKKILTQHKSKMNKEGEGKALEKQVQEKQEAKHGRSQVNRVSGG